MNQILRPIGLLAELTHRCPLQCPYCSNPVELDRKSGELDTATWKRVFGEAAELGVLQVHLSGGEPTARAGVRLRRISGVAAGRAVTPEVPLATTRQLISR